MNHVSSRPTAPDGLPHGIAFDPDANAFASDSSGRAGAMPIGVARAGSIDQVAALVGWANRQRVPLIPVSSRGGPRKGGDTISDTASLIVDLSAMNRVIHADGKDAVAVIEAGVTFDELDTALRPHGLRSFRPLLPRAGKSVMATFLERAPTTVPGHHWDSADPLAALELVFGNGDMFRTGGASLPGTLEENLARGNRQLLAAGPGQTDFGRVVQGAQGSIGIVARGSILCHRIPHVSLPLFVSADNLAPVVATAYKMLRTRPDGHLFIVNAAQLALMLAQDAASFEALKAALPQWILFFELTASSYFPDEALAYRRTDLEAAADAAGAALSDTLGPVSAASVSAALTASNATAYKDRIGLAQEEVFFLSQMDKAQGFVDALTGIAIASEVPTYIQPMTHGVNAHIEFTFLSADQGVARKTARTAAEACAAKGAFFSRPYHLWADLAFARDLDIVGLLARTKEIFDPNAILQPGSQALGLSTGPSL